MKYLEFNVSNMALSRNNADRTAIISGAVGYYGLDITFDEEFGEIAGGKAVEFFKNRRPERVDLVDGKCVIPNYYLSDKAGFEMRVVAGTTVATKWLTVAVEESGMISEETVDEPAPVGYEYVKTPSGSESMPYFRAGTNGVEYSNDGENWNPALEGTPEVPSTPVDALWLRKNGEWVQYEPPEDAITEVKLNGTVLTPTDGSVDIEIEGLQSTATQLEKLDTSETDIPTIVAKINSIIDLLQSRGIATV